VRALSAAIGAVAAFRDQALKAHLAGGVKQIRPDLAQFERRDEDAVGRRASRRARLVLRIESGRSYCGADVR
jgi:hypothetical protein